MALLAEELPLFTSRIDPRKSPVLAVVWSLAFLVTVVVEEESLILLLVLTAEAAVALVACMRSISLRI
jgi:hypothetical protein